ncbi:YbgC/FadM family acyl-CoA thioesterase [Sphingomonas sp. ID0503]|uniref:YbgC/FadM family acyl-CoA thioesterase n=1 Tax=Sphingomonas sp. ID0503 TaxID=3399691 RepID=UPI003AFAA6D8
MVELDLPPSGRIAGTEHRFPLRVYYEDTDAGGIVYHASYLRFMERARSDLLRLIAIEQRAALEAGLGGYVVADLSIRYRKPAQLDDALLVVSTVARIRASAVVVQQRVMRGHELLTNAEVTVAFLANGRATRQPADWVARFEALKG